jgi:excisionase family DNA binding protein
MFDEKFLDFIAEKVVERLLPQLRQVVDSGTKIETRYLTYQQAAGYIGTTYEGIRGMVRRKQVRALYRGSKRHIDRHDLDAFMESNEGKTTRRAASF